LLRVCVYASFAPFSIQRSSILGPLPCNAWHNRRSLENRCTSPAEIHLSAQRFGCDLQACKNFLDGTVAFSQLLVILIHF
jgi:hypothetical protein